MQFFNNLAAIEFPWKFITISKFKNKNGIQGENLYFFWLQNNLVKNFLVLFLDISLMSSLRKFFSPKLIIPFYSAQTQLTECYEGFFRVVLGSTSAINTMRT